MNNFSPLRVIKASFFTFAIVLMSCDLCYYCEEATYDFVPKNVTVDQYESYLGIEHKIVGTVSGTSDPAPTGTKFTLEYFLSSSSSDYASGTKLINASYAEIGNDYIYRDASTAQAALKSDFEFKPYPSESSTSDLIYWAFDIPPGIDNGTYYVHVVAKCSCGGDERSAYKSLGIVTAIDLSVDVKVYPYVNISNTSNLSESLGSPISSLNQDDYFWVRASLSSTPGISDLSELGGTIISKFGNKTILSVSGASFYDELVNINNLIWNDSYSEFIFPFQAQKENYAPGSHELTLSINQTTFDEINSDNNSAKKSIEVKELISASTEFESTFSSSDFSSKFTYSSGWKHSTSAPTGTYSSSMGVISSSTKNDGFAMLDTDADNLTGNYYIYNAEPLPLDPSKETLKFEFEYYTRKYGETLHYYIKFYDSNKNLLVNTYTADEVTGFSSLNTNDTSSNPQKVDWDATSHIQYFLGQYPDISYYKIGLRYVANIGYALMVDDFKVTKTTTSGKILVGPDMNREYVDGHTLPIDIEDEIFNADFNKTGSGLLPRIKF